MAVAIMDKALPVLSREEEQVLVRKAKAGCERSKDKFFRHNLPLVMKLAKKFLIPNYDLEDLVSLGCVAMAKAFNYFDPDRDLKFSTIASKMIVQTVALERRHQDLGHGIKVGNAKSLSDWHDALTKVHPALAEGVLSMDGMPPNTDLEDSGARVCDSAAEAAIEDSWYLSDVEACLEPIEWALVQAVALNDQSIRDFNMAHGIHKDNRSGIARVRNKLEWVRA